VFWAVTSIALMVLTAVLTWRGLAAATAWMGPKGQQVSHGRCRRLGLVWCVCCFHEGQQRGIDRLDMSGACFFACVQPEQKTQNAPIRSPHAHDQLALASLITYCATSLVYCYNTTLPKPRLLADGSVNPACPINGIGKTPSKPAATKPAASKPAASKPAAPKPAASSGKSAPAAGSKVEAAVGKAAAAAAVVGAEGANGLIKVAKKAS